MSQTILVTSFKGGVGKTTVSANLALCLAKMGRKVLACDCDLESRSLDLVLGVDNQPLFNICDAVKGVCDVTDAIVESDRQKGLFFMPAPAFYPEAAQLTTTDEIFTEEAVKHFLSVVTADYDYVIFDLPARPDQFYKRLVRHAGTILVVSQHTAVSIRAAEKTAIALTELCENIRVPDIRLVVNAFHAQGVVKKENTGLYGILDKTKLPLIGVLPFDEDMVKAQEQSELADVPHDGQLPFWIAINNMARRLEGESVKLLSGIRLRMARKKLY